MIKNSKIFLIIITILMIILQLSSLDYSNLGIKENWDQYISIIFALCFFFVVNYENRKKSNEQKI